LVARGSKYTHRGRFLEILVTACVVVWFVLASVASGATTEIRLLTCCGLSSLWTEIAERFTEEHPDIRVVVEVAAGGWQGLEEQFLVAHLGGSAPDLALWQDETFANFAVRGVIANLQPYVEQDSFVESELAHYLPQALQAFQVDLETRAIGSGDLYGISYGGGEVHLFYNTELFERFGVADPPDSWTWDEFLSIGRQLTVIESDGEVSQYGLSMRDLWIYTLLPFVWSNGGDFFTEPVRSRSVFNSSENIETLEFIQSLFLEHQVAHASEQNFFSERAAMRPDGPWFTRNMETGGVDFNWRVAAFPPTNKGPQSQQTRVTFDGIVMSSDTPNAAAAWEFIRYIIAGNGRDLYAQIGELIPVSQRAFAQSVWGDPGYPGHRFVELMPLARVQPIILEWTQVDREMGRLFRELLRGRNPAEVAVEGHEILDRLARESAAL